MKFAEQQKLRREGRNTAYKNILDFVIALLLMLFVMSAESLLDIIMK